MGILDLFARPSVDRSPEEQSRVDEALSKISLYHFFSCPFCAKVRRALKRLDLDVEMRDIRKDRSAFEELVSGGGKKQVPTLRIEESNDEGQSSVRWLYESEAIIRYLEQNFA